MDAGWASLVYSDGGIGQLEFNLVIPQETTIELTRCLSVRRDYCGFADGAVAMAW